MGLFDNLLNKAGYKKIEEKTAGFMTTEIESDSTKAVESNKKTDFKNFIDAFNRLPWLFAGGIALARAAIKPKLKMYKGQGEDKEEVIGEDPLPLLVRPNPFLSYAELIQASVINILINGEHFWNLAGTAENDVISLQNPPVEIWWVKPEQMDVISHPEKFIAHYKFTSATGKTKNLDVSEIIHFKSVNPDSYFRGTGAMPAGENSAILEFNAVTYNKKFLENDGTPSGNYHFPSKPSPKQLKEFKQWQDERHKGAKKAGKFGITYGGIEYRDIGKTPKDMQYAELKKMNREETLATLGVPPSIVGLLEYANYSNMEVQQKKFWEDTVIPILKIIEDKLTLQLAPLFNEEYYFEFDYSNIAALQDDQGKLADTAEKLVRNGIMSPDEAGQRFFGVDPIGGAAALRYLPMNLVPIIGDGEDPKSTGSKTIALPGKKNENDELSYWEDKTRKKVLWKNFVKRVESKEKPFIPIAERYQLEQGERIIKVLKKFDDIKKIDPHGLIDVDDEAEKYRDALKAWYWETLRQAGDSGMLNSEGVLYDLESRQDEGFEITPEMEEELQEMVFYSGTEVNQTLIAQIDRTLRRAEAEAWTVEQFTQAIDAQIQDFSVWRARLWARTETAKTENWGQHEGYKQSEFVDKRIWLSAFASDSRDEHMAADGQKKFLEEPFEVAGELLMYPGDPSASAYNICNCLCTTAPEVMKV